jgi:peptidyl-tRNA hydrolase, PTH1 family
MNTFLVVGLGNPGILYENTRHNFGFKVVKAFAKKYNLEFAKEKKFESKIASGEIQNFDVLLLMPLTYMNESGVAVKKVVDFFKIELRNILILVDDADIPFKEFRIKGNGSSAGHKGLASIEKHLNTKSYARLKIGIGREKSELKSYVLERFTKEEREKLPEIEKKAIEFIEIWLEKGIQIAANKANVRIKKVKKNEGDKK